MLNYFYRHIEKALFDHVWKQLQLIYLRVGRNRKCYAKLVYESKVSEVSHQVVVQCKKCYQTTDARPCLMPLVVKRQLRKQQNNPFPDIFFGCPCGHPNGFAVNATCTGGSWPLFLFCGYLLLILISAEWIFRKPPLIDPSTR